MIEPAESDSDEEPLKCSVIKKSLLSKDVHFFPLSYVCGDPNITEPIFVNGHRQAITTNLASFLRQWRRMNPSVRHNIPEGADPRDLSGGEHVASPYLWIDAICINQSDISERNSQLQFMASIYQASRLTIAWVGKEDDTSSLAMESLDRMSVPIRDSENEQDPLEWLHRGHMDLLKDDSPHFLPLNSVWKSIQLFFHRPYWTRAWILQELVLSENVLILCGNTGFYLNQILYVVNWLKSIRGRGRPDFCGEELWSILSGSTGPKHLGTHMLQKVYLLKRHLLRSKPEEFLPFWFFSIWYTSDYQATDPLDHIYSKLSLASLAKTDTGISPDYSKSVEEVYAEYGQRYSELHGRLSFLRHAGFGTASWAEDPYNLFIPTWAPNWDAWSKSDVRFNTIRVGQGWHADGNPPIKIGRDWSFEGRCLKAHGLVVSHVELSFAVLDEEGFADFCSKILSTTTDVVLYPGGRIPLTSALIRLASMDIDMVTQERWSSSNTPVLLEMICWAQTFPRIEEAFAGQSMGGTQEEVSEAIRQFQQVKDNLTRRVIVDNYRKALLETHNVIFTEEAYMGWGPLGTRKGDLVCVLFGCETPVILRKVGSLFHYIGPCFIVGLIDGEAIRGISAESDKIKLFTID
jgi:Heterokaryon incompatibility protein (HET)